MARFLGKKMLFFMITIVGITFLAFSLSYLSPGDPAQTMLARQGIAPSAELLEKTREELGLNRPMLAQYGAWLVGIIQGDMGTSIKSKRPVSEDLATALPNTLWLAGISMGLTFLLSTPLGIICAKRKGSIFDRAVQLLTYIFASLPGFFISLLLMYVFSVRLNLLPVIGSSGPKGIIMPVMVLSLTLTAWHTRQVRGIVLCELQNQYVIGARSRGVSEMEILLRHILKNSLIPIITLGGITFGALLGGSIIVETIFTWPGIGKLAIDAIGYRDYPMIQGYIVWMALIFLAVNALIELSYGWLDPRVRKGKA